MKEKLVIEISLKQTKKIRQIDGGLETQTNTQKLKQVEQKTQSFI